MRIRNILFFLAAFLLLNPEICSAASKHTTWIDPVTGMEFVWVPQGCFQMGDGFGQRASDEKPVHEVCLDGFWLGKYPVTQAQWTAVMDANPSRFQPPKYPAEGKRPVDSVSWDEAKRFAARLTAQSKTAGNNANDRASYRLPTEAEWEYACRSGGKHEMYPGGLEVGRVAWYAANSGGTTHPVGTLEPNGLGLYDMSGNVFQWTEDMYQKQAYAQHSRNNPVSTTGWGRVARGGYWGGEVNCARCSFRCYQSNRCKPASTGLRLVRQGEGPRQE